METETAAPVLSSTTLASLMLIPLAIIFNLFMSSNERVLPNIPYVYKRFGPSLIGKWRFLIKGRRMMEEGYAQHRVFQMTTQNGALVFLSHDQMAELLRQPDEVIDMVETVRVEFETDLTKLTPYQPIVPHTILANLTPALGRIIPRLWEEVEKAIPMYLPKTDDWTTVKLQEKLQPIVAIVAGSAFIGNELCYTQEWIKPAIGYTVDVMGAAMEMKVFPSFLRAYVAPYLPRIRRAQQYRVNIRRWLGPIIEVRRKAENEPGHSKPDDMLQWMLEKREDFNIKTDEDMAAIQLGVALVSIHSTSRTTTQA